jgi:hypothetical protein
METGRSTVCDYGDFMKIRLLILLLFCTLLSACEALFGYASGDAQEGVVVDAETSEPVSEAFVIGQWSGRGYETSICFHLSMTKTDALGRYYIPAWREKNEFGSTSNQKVVVYAYKSGYHISHLERGNDVIKMNTVDTLDANVEKRIGIVREAARQTFCHSAGESKKSLIEYYSALYDESKIHAGNKQYKDVLFLKYLVDDFKLGGADAEDRYKKDLRALESDGGGQQLPSPTIINSTDHFERGPGLDHENKE